MRMVNFPVTSTAFIPCECFQSVGQAQLCNALSLMLESIISQLLGRLTDVCCTNKGFQLEWGLVNLSGGDIWSGWPFNFLLN